MKKKTLEETIFSIDPDVYNALIKYGQRSNKCLGLELDSLMSLQYWFIKEDAKDYLTNARFTDFILEVMKQKDKEVSREQVDKSDHKEIMKFIFWCMDQLKNIALREREALQRPSNVDFINAGGQKLDKFGTLAIVDDLAEGDLLKWDAVQKQPYSNVFAKLMLDKTKAEISEAYNEIKRKQK